MVLSVQKYIADPEQSKCCTVYTSALHKHHGHIRDMHHAKRDFSIDEKSHFKCITDLFSVHPASCHSSAGFTVFDLLSCCTPGILESKNRISQVSLMTFFVYCSGTG